MACTLRGWRQSKYLDALHTEIIDLTGSFADEAGEDGIQTEILWERSSGPIPMRSTLDSRAMATCGVVRATNGEDYGLGLVNG